MKKLLLWLLGILGVLVGLVLLATVIGMFLPKQHSFARSMRLAQPPDKVWDVVADFAAQPAWRLDVKSVERLPDRNAKPFWRITTTHGSSGYLLTEEAAEPHRLIVSDAHEDGTPFVTWRIEIAPAESGSRITIHESGDFGNPYSRFMVRYVLGQAKFVDDYLTYLAKKFGQTPTIE